MCCPECGGMIVEDIYTHELVCKNCGLVIEEKRPIMFDEVLNDFNKGRATRIGAKAFNFKGYKTTSRDLYKAVKLERLDELYFDGSKEIKEKSHYIFSMAAQLGIDSKVVQQCAMKIYRRLMKKREFASYGCCLVSAVSLYLASKKYRIPLSLKEISSVAEVSRKKLFRCFSKAVEELGTKSFVIDPMKIILRYSEDFEIHGEALEKCKTLCENVKKSGNNPYGVAAAVIYFVLRKMMKRKVTQKEIAKKLGVTERTLIRNLKILGTRLTEIKNEKFFLAAIYSNHSMNLTVKTLGVD